jgi:hypothetical protein
MLENFFLEYSFPMRVNRGLGQGLRVNFPVLPSSSAKALTRTVVWKNGKTFDEAE